jgi:hypothetical protein
VGSARGEDKVLTFEFGATVLLSSIVKCFEELLEYAHNPLSLAALADHRSNGDVFGPVVISISGSILALVDPLADPSSSGAVPVMFKSSGAQVRTAILSSSSSSSSTGVITAVARNVDSLMLLQRLLKCRPLPPPRRTHITTSEISADVRKKIVEQVALRTFKRNRKPLT